MAAAVEAAAAAIESMLQIRIAGSCRHSSPCCQYADHLAALARSVRSVTGSAPPRALKPPGLKTGTPRLVWCAGWGQLVDGLVLISRHQDRVAEQVQYSGPPSRVVHTCSSIAQLLAW